MELGLTISHFHLVIEKAFLGYTGSPSLFSACYIIRMEIVLVFFFCCMGRFPPFSLPFCFLDLNCYYRVLAVLDHAADPLHVSVLPGQAR